MPELAAGGIELRAGELLGPPGSLGPVCAGTHAGVPIAVKVLDFVRDPALWDALFGGAEGLEGWERTVTEAAQALAVMASLRHARLVALRGVVWQLRAVARRGGGGGGGGAPLRAPRYIVMERGVCSLAQRLARREGLDAGTAAQFVLDGVDGLRSTGAGIAMAA